MNDPLLVGTLTVAILANGLLAGVFFAFACAVTTGLRRVDGGAFVSVVRAINAAILNGWFLLVFTIAPVAAVVTAAIHLTRGGDASLLGMVVGAGCSVASFVITAAANVPLNRMLDRSDADTSSQIRQVRKRFEPSWNRWNVLRTLASTAAFISLTTAALIG